MKVGRWMISQACVGPSEVPFRSSQRLNDYSGGSSFFFLWLVQMLKRRLKVEMAYITLLVEKPIEFFVITKLTFNLL